MNVLQELSTTGVLTRSGSFWDFLHLRPKLRPPFLVGLGGLPRADCK
jgi:hypothetical protein